MHRHRVAAARWGLYSGRPPSFVPDRLPECRIVHETPEIQVSSVSKVFGPRPERALERLRAGADRDALRREHGWVLALDDLSLEIRRGEVFVVMGLSGSGKSTLLRLLNGLHRPTAGRVLIAGRDLASLPRRELLALRRSRFGMVFQHFALLPHRTVRGNVEFGLEIQGTPRAERRARAAEALELVGLRGWETRRPDELSGGMRQRVGLARALAVSPDILLMDEAFSALDPLIRADLQRELLALQARLRKTIVFVTHDLDEALRLGDRIAILRDGRLVQVGTPAQIVASPADDYVARFVSGVDPARALTAGVVAVSHGVAGAAARPASVLDRLREAGLTCACVVDPGGAPHGLVTADELARLAGADAPIGDAVLQPVRTVPADTPLAEVIVLAAADAAPIAVRESGGGPVRGIISRQALLAGLAHRGATLVGDGKGADATADGPETTA